MLNSSPSNRAWSGIIQSDIGMNPFGYVSILRICAIYGYFINKFK